MCNTVITILIIKIFKNIMSRCAMQPKRVQLRYIFLRTISDVSPDGDGNLPDLSPLRPRVCVLGLKKNMTSYDILAVS